MTRHARVAVAAVLGVVLQISVRAADPIERLRSHMEQAMNGARGRMGAAVLHLESGTEIAINADERFPMASTFKLPVLVALYDKAKNGQLNWDEMIDIGVLDQHLGSGDLSYRYDLPGVRLSMHNVANLMMLVSDNSAADICLTKAGRDNVNALMRSLGVDVLRVDRPTQELILDYQQRDTARLKDLSFAEIQKQAAAMPREANPVEARFARDDAFAADPRDQATPRAFVRLLDRIWRGEAVDRAASDAILDTMKRCRTGEGRIKGLLPSTVTVAHKTGSIGGVIDDVGIVYLPDGAGHLAIAVMSKQTRAPEADVERAIAEIARYAYDYFTFAAPKGKQTDGGR